MEVRVIITAVPGCGKTTIIKFLKERLANKKVTFANFGDYMFGMAKKRGLAETRDSMRPLSKDVQEKLQLDAAKEIGKIKGDMVIDTHASIKTPFGYWSGLPEKIAKALKPDVVALIEKNPVDIDRQRKGDKHREGVGSRDKESEGEIELHQQVNRAYAAACTAMVKGAVLVVDERGPEEELGLGPLGHAKDAAGKILRLFE